jgi:hypothetical protein
VKTYLFFAVLAIAAGLHAASAANPFADDTPAQKSCANGRCGIQRVERGNSRCSGGTRWVSRTRYWGRRGAWRCRVRCR